MRLYEVAAGILVDRDRVLIARRQEHDHQGGRWEFPGGKRHAGETIAECLRRELIEEIGLEVTIGPIWRALTHVYPDRRVSIYFYICEAKDGHTPRAIECDEIRWVRPEELTTLPFVEGDLAVLPDLARDLAARGGAAARDGVVASNGVAGDGAGASDDSGRDGATRDGAGVPEDLKPAAG
jgi:mutator protein MutT